jgi:hypothetical protein
MVETGYNNGDYQGDSSHMTPAGENNDGGNEHDEKRRVIGDAFRKIVDANEGPVSDKLLKNLPFKPDFFREGCLYLGENVLSKSLLKRKLDEFWQVKDALKTFISDGMELMQFVAPTTDIGRDFSPESIAHGIYHGHIRIYEEDVSPDFSFVAGPFPKVFPAKMRKNCSFPVQWKTDDKGRISSLMSAEEYVGFHNSYVEAFNNMRAFFGLEPLDADDLYMTEEDYNNRRGFTRPSSVPPLPQPPQAE